MCISWCDIVEACGIIISILALAYEHYKDRKSEEIKQASGVAVWLTDMMADEGNTVVLISNMSELPLYEVVLSKDLVCGDKPTIGTGNDSCTYIQVVPPGLYKAVVRDFGGGVNQQFNASITFRDVKGLNWYRDAAGYLIKSKKSSIDLRMLERPLGSAPIDKVQD